VNSEFAAAFQVHSLNETVHAIHGGFADVGAFRQIRQVSEASFFRNVKDSLRWGKPMFMRDASCWAQASLLGLGL
jgi:hypothetical protein